VKSVSVPVSGAVEVPTTVVPRSRRASRRCSATAADIDRVPTTATARSSPLRRDSNTCCTRTRSGPAGRPVSEYTQSPTSMSRNGCGGRGPTTVGVTTSGSSYGYSSSCGYSASCGYRAICRTTGVVAGGSCDTQPLTSSPWDSSIAPVVRVRSLLNAYAETALPSSMLPAEA
jgi:hypothetical protein